MWTEGREGDGRADDGRREGREPVLAVDPDVEQPKMEPDRRRDPGEVVRDRLVDDRDEGRRAETVGQWHREALRSDRRRRGEDPDRDDEGELSGDRRCDEEEGRAAGSGHGRRAASVGRRQGVSGTTITPATMSAA